MDKRDAQILCGLLLSKYDNKALSALGFSSFVEAFNVLGSALSARPLSIKNYRDELDPYFPNRRVGWHKRPLRGHCKTILEKYGKCSLRELTAMVRLLLDPAHEIVPLGPKDPGILDDSGESSFAQRLITGRAAEGFFQQTYRNHREFSNGILVDTTTFGCGFDFRVNFESSQRFAVVEVKGLHEKHGGILLSAKESARAEQLRNKYFLCVVSNFKETPISQLWRDPLYSDLNWKQTQRNITVNTWNTTL